MSERQKITEKMKVHEEWYKRAREMKIEGLPEFIRNLTQDYEHDYGTLCHAIAAAALAAAHAVDHSDVGGITGFLAGAIAWQFIEEWGSFDSGPKQMLCYRHLLYPQYAYRFEKVISRHIADWLKAEAQKTLQEMDHSLASRQVVDHLESVAAGLIPFGFKVEDPKPSDSDS